MGKIVIIGSGASGVHFALTVLQKGYDVVMIDVGHAKPKPENPTDTFETLKKTLPDPTRYFLGTHYEGVVFPDAVGEYYGFPPNKQYVFATPTAFNWKAQGLTPLFSFAQGGLAEAWTAGVYPFNEAELQAFPFGYDDIAPHYREVARRIGVTGAQDDLARFLPWHDDIAEPLHLDQHSQQLLDTYTQHKQVCHTRLRCHLGRSRVATLSAATHHGRAGCSYCGRCLWGCPSDALYTPLVTLNQCHAYKNFTYIPNMYVSYFTCDTHNRINNIVAKSSIDEQFYTFTADKFVLAAGTLSTSKIFMESIRRSRGKKIKLSGLMDNRQILVPFFNLNMFGKRCDLDNYQYHQLAFGIEGERPEEYVHGQITTLKTALIHPIINNLPLNFSTAISLFKSIRTGLGIANINLHDQPRCENYLTLDHSDGDGLTPTLTMRYSPPHDEPDRIHRILKIVKRFLWQLGCMVPPGMVHIRPMGASVHYAGTLPMTTTPCPYTTSPHGQSHDFDNLYIVDGATFPFIPAKNLTFTLMANAIRIAEQAF